MAGRCRPRPGGTPVVPGRELTRLALETTGPGDSAGPSNGVVAGRDHVGTVWRPLIPLLRQLPPAAAQKLLQQSESQMTRLGLNRGGCYSAALRSQADAHALLEKPLPEAGRTLSPSKSLAPSPGAEL